MAASLPADKEFAPTEFSPPPELVRIAVIVLAVAGVAGLWKGAANAIQEGPISASPPAAAGPRTVPAVAKPLPAVDATSDTLLPTKTLEVSATRPPAPSTAPAPPPKPELSAQAEAEPVVEAETPVMVKAAPAAPLPPPIRPIKAEPAAPPIDELDPPPLLEDEEFLLD